MSAHSSSLFFFFFFSPLFSFQNLAICLIVHLHRFNAFYMLFPPLFPGNKLYFLRKTSICRGRVGGQARSPSPCWICSSGPPHPPSGLPLLQLSFPFPPLSLEKGIRVCQADTSSRLLCWSDTLLRRPYTDLLIITRLPVLTLLERCHICLR